LRKVFPGQEIAIYTEEPPADLVCQFQDGSLTYGMNQCLRNRTRVPLNFTRFALAGFKTFESLICDRPAGFGATGVEWVFFNGEGIWLEGEAKGWFKPWARETIRKCHRILCQYLEAFSSLNPVPLYRLCTLVFAPTFSRRKLRLFTLHGSRPMTYRGGILRVPGKWQVRDFRSGKPPAVSYREGATIVSTEIGPLSVGCLLFEPGRWQAF